MQTSRITPQRKIGIKENSLSGKFQSWKMNKSIAFESSLERDLLELLEFDYNVFTFFEQPVKIPYLFNSVEKNYYPDFLVFYRDDLYPAKKFSPMLCEVKYRKDLRSNWKELYPKFKAAIKYSKEKGYRFKIVTEEEIRTPFLFNAKFLLTYRGFENIDIDDFDLLIDNIFYLGVTTPEELIKVSGGADTNRQAILLFTLWYMIAKGYVNCDLTQPVNMRTEIW